MTGGSRDASRPHYTSPEQLAGLPLTTASDIYSLGVLLYRLLTGSLPYRFETAEPDGVRQVISEQEPERPGLGGDLDAIVLKTLAKEPESRYSSVEQLADDIRRYLKGLPVLAREPTFLYRAGKFVGRHRLSLAAAAIVVLLGCGLILAQAREIAQVRRLSISGASPPRSSVSSVRRRHRIRSRLPPRLRLRRSWLRRSRLPRSRCRRTADLRR